LLFQRLPFTGDNLYEIVYHIRENTLEIPADCDSKVEAVLRQMLEVSPAKRTSVAELLENPLFANAAEIVQELPPVPSPVMTHGRVVQIEAKVCNDGYTFAQFPVPCAPPLSVQPRRQDALISGLGSILERSHRDHR
jgi:serine/threonine protein kinase